jgi:hypothetical protein
MEKIVSLITLAFTTGNIPSLSYNAILVLVPKPGNNGVWGIALLETIYKVMSMIIHPRLMSTINLHESIHGPNAAGDGNSNHEYQTANTVNTMGY